MIIKGNRHGNGAKLAAYLLDGGKHGERVAAPELHGFGLYPDDISKSFSALDAIASGKGIENPLFHIQIRLPKGDYMTPEQWDITTARTLKTAGLEGQPYARVLHTDKKTGEIHCHLGVSLIDEQTNHVKPVPFYKLRFKALARKLENEFDLTRVKNHREGPIKYGATKNEEQQAQRLGVDKDAIRNAIRHCWDISDCGGSFENALAAEGLILAQGNRRDYLVIDHAGGPHALGKRILDASAGQVREKLADLDRDQMPTIHDVREFLLNIPRDRMDKLTRELAQVQEQLKAEREYANRDPVREEADWLDRVAKAAIEKEKIERQFVEPQQRERETRAGREQAKAPELGRTRGEIRLAYTLTQTGPQFAAALEDRGLILAQTTEADADRLNRWEAQRLREQAREQQDYQKYRAGELVVVNQHGDVFKLTRSNTGDDAKARAEHLKDIDLAPLLNVTAAQGVMKKFQQEQREERHHAWKQKREADWNEKHWPISPPQPESKSSELFGKAATEAGRDDRAENLHGPAAQVWQAWQHSDNAQAYAAALDDKGIMFARVTKEEADRSHSKEAQFARAVGNYAPRFREGEIVIVTEARLEYRRDGELTERSRVYKLDQSLAYKFVKGLDSADKLQGIDATIKASDQRAQQRAADWQAIRLERATDTKPRARPLPARAIATAAAKGPLIVAGKAPAILKPVGMGLNLVGKTLEILGGVFEPPVLTPEQKRAGAIAARERQADVRDQLEHSNAIAQRAQERQREEQEEAARQRQRENERER